MINLHLFLLSISLAHGNFLPKNFRSEFIQSYVNAHGEVKRSSGKLGYQYPGNLRIETSEPNRVLLVTNPEKTWYYVPSFDPSEPGEVTINSSENSLLSKFFDHLKNGLTSNKIYTVEKNSADATYTLLFRGKSAKELGIVSAQLWFKGKVVQFKQIERVRLNYQNKKQVDLTFTEIGENVSFPAKHFHFDPPANTRINN